MKGGILFGKLYSETRSCLYIHLQPATLKNYLLTNLLVRYQKYLSDADLQHDLCFLRQNICSRSFICRLAVLFRRTGSTYILCSYRIVPESYAGGCTAVRLDLHADATHLFSSTLYEWSETGRADCERPASHSLYGAGRHVRRRQNTTR